MRDIFGNKIARLLLENRGKCVIIQQSKDNKLKGKKMLIWPGQRIIQPIINPCERANKLFNKSFVSILPKAKKCLRVKNPIPLFSFNTSHFFFRDLKRLKI